MGQTPGKGPFARRSGAKRISSVRWKTPLVQLTPADTADFLRYLKGRNDPAALRIFTDLIRMPPRYRLARNISALLRCLAASDITDVLAGGLTDVEDSILASLERSGIALHLLGVAHALLHVRERQLVLCQLGDAFTLVESEHYPLEET